MNTVLKAIIISLGIALIGYGYLSSIIWLVDQYNTVPTELAVEKLETVEVILPCLEEQELQQKVANLQRKEAMLHAEIAKREAELQAYKYRQTSRNTMSDEVWRANPGETNIVQVITIPYGYEEGDIILQDGEMFTLLSKVQ